ncbi:MAG: TonB-dependent receptor [Ignavibacteriales bacterium]|nr:TonB-dependent receptor [Ignavibacteriales bacterium]
MQKKNLKRIISTILAITIFQTFTFSQKLSQTVRGTILDIDNKLSLIGANVSIVGTDPVIGTTTDMNGIFKFENVPIGRITLRISSLGYETKIIPDIVVNSGKEVVLDLSMQESAVKMDEVVITPNENKGEALNDMSLISSRSISLEETKRFTGGMDDPSRVISSFAGVTSSPDGSSDIIVRGNSPKYLQWRLDGIEISSPYHMNDQNSSFGALTALNNSLLATSDFHSGAFSPEYGDVLASVMDIRLRTGNNERFEAAFGVGILGIDLTLEGPFKNDYAGSYLVNYRYSTVSLIKKLGLVDVKGVVDYQDVTFKVVLPTKNIGRFTFFGLGGLSGFNIQNFKPGEFTTPGSATSNANISKDFKKEAYLANFGMNHILTINDNSYLSTSLYYSGTGFNDDIFESDSVSEKMQTFKSRIVNSAFRGAIAYSNKINARNKIQIGAKYTLFGYNYDQSIFKNEAASLFNVTDFQKNISTINNFIIWKHKFDEDITLVAGIHNMNVLLNNKFTIEPRIAMNWNLCNTSALHAGYGKHSTMESVHNYFTKVRQTDGSVIEPNKNLDLLKAHHFVLGYENRYTEFLIAKIEIYYQHLYDLPVENNDTSYYATINEGVDYQYVPLVNKGVGKNYGIEFTLEHFFNDNYYYLLNVSLFNSKYKSLEGMWRNTQYNNNYLVNLLFGKEFKNLGTNQNQTLSINSKVFFGGGKKYIPLLRDVQGNVEVNPTTNIYWDYKKAYDNKFDNIYQINLSASYKYNTSNTTHEIFLDLMNLTDNKSRISEYYDESKPDKVGYLTQFGFFPNLMYRVYF